MAPQVLLRQNHSFCADYFAVGIIAYELVMNKRPYNGRNRKEIRDDMLARQAKIPANVKTVSKECIDFINKVHELYSDKRPRIVVVTGGANNSEDINVEKVK